MTTNENAQPTLTDEEWKALEYFRRNDRHSVKGNGIIDAFDRLFLRGYLQQSSHDSDSYYTILPQGRAALAAYDAQGERAAKRPVIVCLCGSTRFSQAFQDANFNETLAGRIVLTIGCDMKSDNELFNAMSQSELDAVKTRLDALHLAKIDLADEILVLNVDGYIGQSTRRELEYAQSIDKGIRYLEPVAQEQS